MEEKHELAISNFFPSKLNIFFFSLQKTLIIFQQREKTKLKHK